MTRLTTFDLPQFTRSTVGFDRLFDELSREFANGKGISYPPYNVIQDDEDSYTIEIAVAGFGMENLDITLDKNTLTIEGTAPEVAEDVTYLHKGIAGRNFRRQFTLADHIEVVDATLDLGILNIKLKRFVPEELQPKKIAIKATNLISN